MLESASMLNIDDNDEASGCASMVCKNLTEVKHSEGLKL